jgi:hypothetical protein
MSTEVIGNNRKTVDAILAEQALTGRPDESLTTKMLRALALVSGKLPTTKKLIAVGVATWADTATSKAVTISGLLTTDTIIATLQGQGASEVLQKAVPTANTLTFTISAAGTSGSTKVGYAVYR